MKISDTCDYCGEYVKSPYNFRHEDVWYSGHKGCMGAPMIRKLTAAITPTLSNIALTGRLRSGKDTVAAYLTERYGYTRFAFGDELKRYANELFDVEPGAKPRELYQWFGQALRQRDPDVWVRKCLEAIADSANAADLADTFMGVEEPSFRAVVTDCRQPNENSALKERGYVIIRVNASEGVRINRAVESADTFNYADLAHETESHVDTFAVDYDVYNVGSLPELYAQIDAIITGLNVKDSAK